MHGMLSIRVSMIQGPNMGRTSHDLAVSKMMYFRFALITWKCKHMASQSSWHKWEWCKICETACPTHACGDANMPLHAITVIVGSLPELNAHLISFNRNKKDCLQNKMLRVLCFHVCYVLFCLMVSDTTPLRFPCETFFPLGLIPIESPLTWPRNLYGANASRGFLLFTYAPTTAAPRSSGTSDPEESQKEA